MEPNENKKNNAIGLNGQREYPCFPPLVHIKMKKAQKFLSRGQKMIIVTQNMAGKTKRRVLYIQYSFM
jgi:hypothetical protein